MNMSKTMKYCLNISFFLLAGIICGPTYANVWDDLWDTRDQQASKAFKQKEYDKAAELFENDQWQAASSYKKGDFDAATLQFSKKDDVESLYNKGNSLAKAKQFKQALESYEQVLKDSPTHEDTLFNKKIVEELLKQQQEKQKQEQDKKDQENKEKQDSDSDSDSDSQSEQDSEENSEEKENSEQQESEQQSKEESEKQAEEKQAQMSEDDRDQNEKDQALEHWLEKIPDDPGGLLRRKMYREYQRRGRQQEEKKIW